ncbi:MAG TPA: hypothetical protein VJ377_00865 [Dehalococcoidales bacterium]|nr:MAG: hypothetical protein A2Z05_01955 [Chloroflexi bacterium RBG_16_60_22]HJX12055.1 hypothetical protein [Dehalococcoidales bacterium]
MGRRNIRVILASGSPSVRHFLREAVEVEPGTTVIGQAENAARALTMARNLRPDIAIIDSYLPYSVGLDSVPLSRIGGLDTAQAAFEEIPNLRVVLLNMDTVPTEDTMRSDYIQLFSREVGGVSTPFTLQELFNETRTPDSLVFARVQARANGRMKSKIDEVSSKAILFGTIGILLGLILVVTLILAVPGGFITLAGLAMLAFGGLSKLAMRLRPGAPAAGGRQRS